MLWYYVLVAIRGMHASSDALIQEGAPPCSSSKAKQHHVEGSEKEEHETQQTSQQQQQQQQLHEESGNVGVPRALQHSQPAGQPAAAVNPDAPSNAEVPDSAGTERLVDSRELLLPGQGHLQQSRGVKSGEKKRPQVPCPMPEGALNHVNPSSLQPKCAQRAAHRYGLDHPVMRKMLAEALKGRSEMPIQQRYSSRTNQSGRLHPNKGLQCAQQACRVGTRRAGVV
eukprot:1144734-Pelagomonas_calceolata.AAC.4